MLWTNTLVWKTHCLANMAMKGDFSTKEILRIGMFRTPFSCVYYQQHKFCETKIILSCLFLLEAHGLEYLYYRPIIVNYHDNTCIKIWHIYQPNALANEETLLGTQIIPSLPSIEHIVVILFAGSSWTCILSDSKK